MDIRPKDTLISVDVPIINDGIDEEVEIFTVELSPTSEFILIENPFAIVQIIDADVDHGEQSADPATPPTPTCKAFDSIVIEPFRLPTAPLDSFTFHSPCEHILLTTCDTQIRYQPRLRVTIKFSPNNLDLLSLAVNINHTQIIKVLRNSMIELTNVSNPISPNSTHSLYPNGVLIVQQENTVKIILQDLGVEIRRSFGLENRVEIVVLEETEVTGSLCGLCGRVDGRLVYSDGEGEATSNLVMEVFASNWRVSPQEVLLGQQGEECGNWFVFLLRSGKNCIFLSH